MGAESPLLGIPNRPPGVLSDLGGSGTPDPHLRESQRRYLPRAGLNPRPVRAAGITLWICPPEVFELRVCVVLAQIGMNSTRARSPVWNASPTVVFILLTFGLLSKQSSLQMVGERRHSTIMLVGYKSLFLSEVSKLLWTRSTICFLSATLESAFVFTNVSQTFVARQN